MPRLDLLKPGDVLYDVRRQRMGNTTMSQSVAYEVRIVEVHSDHAMASWNGNKAAKYWPAQLAKLRRSEPKRLNGHDIGCPGYHDSFYRECTCRKVSK